MTDLLLFNLKTDMDDDVQSAYNQVAGSLKPGAAFSDVVPLFLDKAHGQLDEVIRRIKELHNQKQT